MLRLYKSVLTDNFLLVTFDVVSMFQNIDSKSGLKGVKDLYSAQFIVDALEICVTLNLTSNIFYRLMLMHKGLTCLAPLMMLKWPNMTF